MCRNIRPLFNYEPPTTPEQVHDAALQYVRKVSGYHEPSRANQAAFDRAVKRITTATQALLEALETEAPPRDREAEIEKAGEKSAQRFGNATTLRHPTRIGRG
jgi:hypothetical protein